MAAIRLLPLVAVAALGALAPWPALGQTFFTAGNTYFCGRVDPPEGGAEWKLWSNPTTWPDGAVPDGTRTVVVPCGAAILLDVSPPVLQAGLQVFGHLKFLDEGGDIAVTTAYIVVLGQLTIGEPDRHYQRLATITLLPSPDHHQWPIPDDLPMNNLRIREDTAKYLRNLDVDSAHYDPKTRSMREDPNPEADPGTKFYAGDNFIRQTGQTLEHQQLTLHAWEAFDKGQDIHMQAVPSAAEMLHREFKEKKAKLVENTKKKVLERYGNAAAEKPDEELLPAQTEAYVEYNRAGRVIKGKEGAKPVSKWAEDVLVNNHTAVWGSWWRDGTWGYACCHSTVKSSYCTGQAGIDAAAESQQLMQKNMDRLPAASGSDKESDFKSFKGGPSWGSGENDKVELDEAKLRDAIRKEEARQRAAVETNDRRRKYNVDHGVDVSAEEMEAYRLKRQRPDDPMAAFLGKDDE